AEFDDLSLGSCAIGAKDIDVKLPKLSLTTALRALVAHELCYRVPSSRVSNFLPTSSHHAANTWRHLGTDSDSSITSVGKLVRLVVHQFVTAFSGIDLKRLQERSVVRLVAVTTNNLTPGIKDVLTHTHIFWVEVARTFIWFRRDLAHTSVNCGIFIIVLQALALYTTSRPFPHDHPGSNAYV